MMRRARPLTVEVRHKRGYRKPVRSIWGDLDLSKAVSEVVQASEQAGTTKARLVDSDVGLVVVETFNEPSMEYSMLDNELPDSAQAAAPAVAKEQTGPRKKAPRATKSRTQSASSARRNAPRLSSGGTTASPTARAGRKVYSQKERAAKLSQIEKSVQNGASTKQAIKEAGISEQTYYQWRRATTTPPASDDLKDLLALEEENKRLKGLLAGRLRKENAELKKKLGLK